MQNVGPGKIYAKITYAGIKSSSRIECKLIAFYLGLQYIYFYLCICTFTIHIYIAIERESHITIILYILNVMNEESISCMVIAISYRVLRHQYQFHFQHMYTAQLYSQLAFPEITEFLELYEQLSFQFIWLLICM